MQEITQLLLHTRKINLCYERTKCDRRKERKANLSFKEIRHDNVRYFPRFTERKTHLSVVWKNINQKEELYV